MKIGTQVRARWIIAKLLDWTDPLPNQSFWNPTKQKRVARSHPTACPTSSARTNCLCVPGLTSTSARNKLLKKTAIPTLIQNDRGNCRCLSLGLILCFILLYSGNFHCPAYLLSSHWTNYTDVLIQYAMFLLSHQGNGSIGQGKRNEILSSMCTDKYRRWLKFY